MAEAVVDCPVCDWGNHEYFDGTTGVTLECDQCGSTLSINEYSMEVDIHRVEVDIEKRKHEEE